MGEPFDFRDKSQVPNELTAAAEVASGDRTDQAGHGTLQRFGSRAGQLVGAVQMASAASCSRKQCARRPWRGSRCRRRCRSWAGWPPQQ